MTMMMYNRYFMVWAMLLWGVLLSHVKTVVSNEIQSRDMIRQLQFQAVGRIVSFRLIDADTNMPLMEIRNGQVINLPIQGSTNFNIDAVTANGDVGSVLFGYLGNDRYRLESIAPFAVCGDFSPTQDYYACPRFTESEYVVEATPFSEMRAQGIKGTSVTLNFSVRISPPTAAPVKASTKAPVIVPTVAPRRPTTKAPILVTTAAPRRPPTKAPTKAPRRPPTRTPTRAPTKAPQRPPTRTPTRAPTNAPRRPPTKTPTRAPVVTTMAPRTPPTGTPRRPPTGTPTSISKDCTIPKFDDEQWQTSGPRYPIHRVAEPEGLLIGDDLVIFSGFTQNLSVTVNHTYAKNVLDVTSPWRRMDDLPMPTGITHAALSRVGSKVYLCGGYLGGHPGPHVPDCFVYDHSISPGSQRQWSRFASLPSGGSAGGGMIYDTVRNTLFYAGGGQRRIIGSPHPVDIDNTWKIRLSDPRPGWVASTPFPYLANHLSYVTHRDSRGSERHFFLGGQVGEIECCANFGLNYEFIASSETWVRRASIPIPRGHASSSTRAVGCGFVVAGGSTNSETSFKNRTNDISYYDIPTNTWTSTIGLLPASIATPIVDIHSNGYMYFVSGYPQNFQRRMSD